MSKSLAKDAKDKGDRGDQKETTQLALKLSDGQGPNGSLRGDDVITHALYGHANGPRLKPDLSA